MALTYEETVAAFSAAKQYVRDLEATRNYAFSHSRPWSQEQQDELDEAKEERSRLAKEATEMGVEARNA